MEPHRKGELTEAVVIAELKRREIPVLVPFGDNERYDIVAESRDGFHRLQVKTGTYDGATVKFKGFSVHTNAVENVHETYENEIDFFVVYCHELESMYFVDEADVTTAMPLRVADPEIEQPSINWAEDYEFDKLWPPTSA